MQSKSTPKHFGTWLALDVGGEDIMIPQLNEATNKGIEAELDRLTYSAYLLTLDPALAISVVMSAIDSSLEQIGEEPDLLIRTVELALEQRGRESHMYWDDRSSSYDAILCGDSKLTGSEPFVLLANEASSNPIASLDPGARVAFVLHHVIGYPIRKAATMAEVTEKEYRAQLRKAYVQLAAFQFGPYGVYRHALEKSAEA